MYSFNIWSVVKTPNFTSIFSLVKLTRKISQHWRNCNTNHFKCILYFIMYIFMCKNLNFQFYAQIMIFGVKSAISSKKSQKIGIFFPLSSDKYIKTSERYYSSSMMWIWISKKNMKRISYIKRDFWGKTHFSVNKTTRNWKLVIIDFKAFHFIFEQDY